MYHILTNLGLFVVRPLVLRNVVSLEIGCNLTSLMLLVFYMTHLERFHVFITSS